MSSISLLINDEANCPDILSIFLNFSQLESKLYFHLLQNGKKTIVELCKDISRDQSTVHRALQKLVSQKIAYKTKQNKSPRGYQFLYSAAKPENVKETLFNLLNRLYKYTSQCIDDFETRAIECEISFT